MWWRIVAGAGLTALAFELGRRMGRVAPDAPAGRGSRVAEHLRGRPDRPEAVGEEMPSAARREMPIEAPEPPPRARGTAPYGEEMPIEAPEAAPQARQEMPIEAPEPPARPRQD